MIFPLMLYTLAIGALIALAAVGLEGALRLAGRPTRCSCRRRGRNSVR